MINSIQTPIGIFKIKVVEGLHNLGEINFNKRLIRISNLAQDKNKILLHELSHLFIQIYLPKRFNDETLTEQLTKFYGSVFEQIK